MRSSKTFLAIFAFSLMIFPANANAFWLDHRWFGFGFRHRNTYMVLSFFLFAVIFLFASCTEMGERNNSDDPRSINYRGEQLSNISSSHTESSSSESPSSSSAVLSSSSVVQSVITRGTPVTYEGETYQTVVIGTQTWMARNLNYAVEGSKCGGTVLQTEERETGTTLTYYLLEDGNTTNCNTYGRLYNWATAMKWPDYCNSKSCASSISTNHQGICPSGWHIPSYENWEALINFAGGDPIAGEKLKATTGWIWDDYRGKSGNGEDWYGFAALPGGYGYGNSNGYSLSSLGGTGTWWSSSENNADRTYCMNMYYFYYDWITSLDSSSKPMYMSVRCVKD